MFANDKKINKIFFFWLLISLLLVFLIIIVGGLTRLTNSGLSITEWELFSGLIPPTNFSSWNKYFDQYKEIPQYKLLNFDMSLNEFKVIFYWEYIHRIIARFIGLFFMLPLIFFYFSNKIKTEYINICLVIFTLIIFQGIIGWYMVKSGLVNEISVSHFRLSAHLLMAILIISIIFWLLKNIQSNKFKIFFNFNRNNAPFQILIFLILVQIAIGAFVSGLDAGKIYQTWPKMGSSFIPNDLMLDNLKEFFELDNRSLIQFYHRKLAYIIILYSIFLGVHIYRKKIHFLFNSYKFLMFFIFIQITLGIFTLISGLNIFLASMHQITSVLLVFSALNLYYLVAK